MIATEAAAEGINLQFCSLVVNYDLPWNPQRIEQRIGRCHRYGQKFDVVVVNFLNKNNAADQRVYELLEEKFQLFDGVFGASDEVLGAIESGVDFEKRILEIYQKCRTDEEIKASFDELQQELESQIDEKMKETRTQLLENFDEEVHEKLRVHHEESRQYLNKYEQYLWELTKYYLEPHAEFIPGQTAFTLKQNPFPDKSIPLKQYKMGKRIEDAAIYRIGHPLAQNILKTACGTKLSVAEIRFDYSSSPTKISILEPLVGKTGYLSLILLTVSALEQEDYLVFAGITEEGDVIDDEQARRLFSLPGKVVSSDIIIDVDKQLEEILGKKEEKIIEGISARNSIFFDEEMEKLDSWAEDLKESLEIQLKQMDIEIKQRKTEARKIPKLENKIEARRLIHNLESKRNKLRNELFQRQNNIENDKEKLLDDVQLRLSQKIVKQEIFKVRWVLS